MIAEYFWLGMTIACVLWYTFITAYVGVKGAFDIRSMLDRLGEQTDSKTNTRH